jgi:AraC-like DNA-binding protein
MSTSTFHRSFQAVTALSPVQFRKRIRLQRSRLMLMTGAGDVATVGYRVGYDSASQFSREYRRQFGLPLGATLRPCAASRSPPSEAAFRSEREARPFRGRRASQMESSSAVLRARSALRAAPRCSARASRRSGDDPGALRR